MMAGNELHHLNEVRPHHQLQNAALVAGGGVAAHLAGKLVHDHQHKASQVAEIGLGSTGVAVAAQEMVGTDRPWEPVAAAVAGAVGSAYVAHELGKRSEGSIKKSRSRSRRRSVSPVVREVDVEGARSEAFVQHVHYDVESGHHGRRGAARAH